MERRSLARCSTDASARHMTDKLIPVFDGRTGAAEGGERYDAGPGDR